ncbi:MAG TPA: diaminobutyrate acetyltransferase [Pseudonocardiaceae bacterium]|nr:diaminobutyrate acetyltransferase [Pseudonocardiaceae bacterium]
MPLRVGDVTFGAAMRQQEESLPDHRQPRAAGNVAGLTIAEPASGDGPHLWRLARDSARLDVNSSYAYLLWCREFAGTSTVARVDGTVVGFVTGFIRPRAPDTVLVWQVAVDAKQRGRHLASRMLHALVDRLSPKGVRWMQTTVSPSNEASIRLFTALARDRGAGIERCALFAPEDFPTEEPSGHESEDLYVIGPFSVFGVTIREAIGADQ